MKRCREALTDMCRAVVTTAYVSLSISVLLLIGAWLFGSLTVAALGAGAGIPAFLIWIQAMRADIYLDRLEESDHE